MTKRPPSIRLTRDAESTLGHVVELLGRGQPIPPSRGDALHYSISMARWYLAHQASRDQPFPTIDQMRVN